MARRAWRSPVLLTSVTLCTLGTFAALSFVAPSASAQQAVPPVAAKPAPAAPPPPEQEPAYDPSQHGGLSEGAFLRATRGTGRRSTGMMATGITFVTLGAALMASGSAVYLGANQCSGNGMTNPDGSPQGCSVSSGQATGMALLAAGLVGLGIGIPLTIFGSADVPRIEAGRVTSPSFPRANLALGLGSAAFALHF
jgi:hypothetical protein